MQNTNVSSHCFACVVNNSIIHKVTVTRIVFFSHFFTLFFREIEFRNILQIITIFGERERRADLCCILVDHTKTK